MRGLILIVAISLLLFITYGIRNPKRVFLIMGLLTMPLRITYSPFIYTHHVGFVSGLIISISDVFFICLFFTNLLSGNEYKGISPKVAIPLAVYIISNCLSVINSESGMLTFYQTVMLCQIAFLYYYVLCNNIVTKDDIIFVLRILTLSLLCQCSLSTVQYITGRTFDIFSTGKGFSNLMSASDLGRIARAVGTVGKPNGFAAFIVPILILNFCISFLDIKDFRKIRKIAILIGIIGLILSFSRGGWLSFFIVFILLIKVGIKRKLLSGAKILILILFVGAIILGFWHEIDQRLISRTGEMAVESRIPLMKIAIEMFKQNTFFGVGANTFRNVVKNYVPSEYGHIYLNVVHNQYLLVLSETGLVGLGAFLWLGIALLKQSIFCLSQNKDLVLQAIGLGITLGILASAIHMNVDTFSSPLLYANLLVFGSIGTSATRILAEQMEHDKSSSDTRERN